MIVVNAIDAQAEEGGLRLRLNPPYELSQRRASRPLDAKSRPSSTVAYWSEAENSPYSACASNEFRRLRAQFNFSRYFNLICPVQSSRKNIPVSFRPKSPAYSSPSRPKRGAARDRHERGAGCGGREGALDEQRRCGRRSRVVLTPRCWRQVCEKQASRGRRWQKSRSPRRARSKPLKPLRREGRTVSAEPVCSCAFFSAFARETAGAARTRSSLRPLI